MREYTTRKAKLLRPSELHIRSSLGSDAELKALGQSYLAKPHYPIVISTSGEIIDGNRRHSGVMMNDPEAELYVCITNEEVTPASLIEMQYESSIHNKALSFADQAVFCREWLRLNPTATAKDLAARVRKDESGISRLISLFKCCKDVQDAAFDGKIGPSEWAEIAKHPADKQMYLLGMKLGGATRAELVKASKDKPDEEEETARLDTVRIALPDEVTITVKGKSLSLKAIGEALLKAHKEATAGEKDGLTAKTFQNAMRDRAKKPVNGKA